MMALWSYLIDVQLICGMFFFDYLISKESFLCRFFMHFANLWLLSCLLWGDVWLRPCFPSLIHIIALDFLFFITTSVSGGGVGGVMLLLNNTFTTSSLVSGGIWTGYDCLSFIPLLPDGNQLIIHSCRFLDMEQSEIQISLFWQWAGMFTVAY